MVPGEEQKQEQNQKQQERRRWQYGVAGAVAGMATTSLLHPLDIVRTRMQVNDRSSTAAAAVAAPAAAAHIKPAASSIPHYDSTRQALATIAKTEGIRGLYAGLYPSLLGSTVSWALYFFFYNSAKMRYCDSNKSRADVSGQEGTSGCTASSRESFDRDTRSDGDGKMHQHQHQQQQQLLLPPPPQQGTREVQDGANKQPHLDVSCVTTPLQHMLAATEAGVLSTLLTNPIWVVKTRLQLQVRRQPQLQQPSSHYKGFNDALRTIVREEGIRGLYSGLGPALVLVSHGTIQFVVYEELKRAVAAASASAEQRCERGQQRQQVECETHTQRQQRQAARQGLEGEGDTQTHGLDGAVGNLHEAKQQQQGREQLQQQQQQQQQQQHEKLQGLQLDPKEQEDSLTWADYLAVGAVSKLSAVLVTYPYQVVRSRMQMRPEGMSGSTRYRSTLQAMRIIWGRESIHGFYKGLAPHLLRVLPASSLTLTVYEMTLKMLQQM